MDAKKEGTKALGVVVGTGVALGVTMLVIYLVNYGLSTAQTFTQKS